VRPDVDVAVEPAVELEEPAEDRLGFQPQLLSGRLVELEDVLAGQLLGDGPGLLRFGLVVGLVGGGCARRLARTLTEQKQDHQRGVHGKALVGPIGPRSAVRTFSGHEA
jgi:hypothetical protein